MKGFKKCCISGAINSTDDDTLCSDSEVDGNVRSVCEGDEGTDYENGDSASDW